MTRNYSFIAATCLAASLSLTACKKEFKPSMALHPRRKSSPPAT
jgi:hypothetical protein